MEHLNIDSILDRENISVEIRNFLQEFEINKSDLSQKRGLYIYGSPGCGKSQFIKTILNRLNYDTGAYTQELNQSVGPGVDKLGEPHVSCEQCYPYPPSVRLQRQGDSIDKTKFLIDISLLLPTLINSFSILFSKTNIIALAKSST